MNSVPISAQKTGVEVVCELLEFAQDIRAERHRRENPHATEAEVAAVVRAWMMDRPGAPYGDAVGRSVSWPRPSVKP
jgi:hypothetical protein